MGDETLLQGARAVAPLVSGDRLVLARELKAWTQREAIRGLADDGYQLSGPALSQLENGHTRPSPPTLAALCNLYGCPPEFFVERPKDKERQGFFRSLKAAPARDRKQYLARARLLREFVWVLEEYVVLPEIDVPDHELDPERLEAAEGAAEAVRDDWGLPPGPIDNVVRTLERHGIVVVRSHRAKREIDAFSVRYPDRPIVVLGTGDTVASRSRFDAAHELGHLVMHRDEHANTKAAEQQAHRFAAAFLMPSADIRAELPGVMDVRRLLQLKAKWRVSMQALLMRARVLGVMSPQRYTNSMKMVSARGWRRREPGDDQLGPIEAPTMIQRALELLTEEEITVRDLCDEGALPFDEVNRLLMRTRDRRPRLEL